ncbi:hypothetical protein RI129_003461 [Pyrocoelia pectoralis]|uniref:Luciferin 4-monooxygenase n=1 Tax=Pyrocoelia pectoralis TaxID=417401 RepID=A0AAN7VR89_9COLE
MGTKNGDCILYGPKEEFKIRYESLGLYLHNCLKERGANEILVTDAASQNVLTCGDALNKCIKLCKVLKSMSLKKGDVVAVISENILNTYVALLGTLLSGTTGFLLNFKYTPGELKHALDLAKPKVVLCSLTVVPNLLNIKEKYIFMPHIITIDGPLEFNNEDLSSMDSLIENVSNTDDLQMENLNIKDSAFLLLSSGTTGLPKCVELSHENLIPTVNIINDARYLGISKEDVVVSILPFFHIYGLILHLSPIFTLAKVILMKHFKPDLFLQLIQDNRPTKLFIVPPILHFLLKSPMVNNYDISSLKVIFIGAAPLGKDIYEDALKRFKDVSIRQLYGTTETSGICTIQQSTDCSSGDVGSLVCNFQCKVTDLCTNKAIGALRTGELCFKSIGVSNGYYKKDTEINGGFVDDDGFYHTGDVGYYDEMGKIFIVDRIKDIIKYKGFQVAPAELEDLLLSHLAVRDCGVIGVPDERAGELPLAFVVRQNGKNVTEQELIDFVAGELSFISL